MLTYGSCLASKCTADNISLQKGDTLIYTLILLLLLAAVSASFHFISVTPYIFKIKEHVVYAADAEYAADGHTLMSKD